MPKFGNEQSLFEHDYTRMVKADPYILRHFAEHLHKAGRVDRLYKLLVGNKAWMEAKFLGLGEDSEYLADLNLATSSFSDPLTRSQLLILIQLRMARSVVNVRANACTDNDLQTLVYLGRDTEALSSAKLRIKADAKFNGLQSVWAALFKKGIYNQTLLEEIFSVVDEIDDPRKRAFALVEVVIAFSLGGKQEKAFEALMRIDDTEAFLEAQIGMVSAFAKGGHIEDAFKVLDDISNTKAMVRALAILSIYLFQINDGRASVILKSARENVGKLKGANRDYELIVLVNILARNGRIGEVRSIIKAMSKKQAPIIRDMAIYELAGALARSQRFEEMRSILNELAENTPLLKPSLVAAITAGGNLDSALSMANCLGEPYKSMALRSIVLTLAEAKQYEKLMAIVPEISNKSQLLSEIAVRLAAAGDIPHAEIVLNKALADNEVDYLIYSARLMRGDLSSALAVAGHIDLGINLASTIKSRIGHSVQTRTGVKNIGDTWSLNSEERTTSLLTIVTALTWAGQLDMALTVAKKIFGKYSKAEAYFRISEALASSGKFNQAISIAKRITYINVRARALSVIAKALAEAGDDKATDVFIKGVELALRNARNRESTLLEVVSAFLPSDNPRMKQVFEDMIRTICCTRSLQKRISALWDISTALAQAGDQRAVAVFNDMLLLVEQIRSRGKRSDLLQSIAQALALAGNCKAREILLKAYKLEYGDDNSWLSSFIQSLTYSLSLGQDTLDNLIFLFAEDGSNHANRFLEDWLNEAMKTEDIYFKISALRDIVVSAALAGNSRSLKVLESLLDLVIENKVLDEVRELCKRLAEAGDIHASTLYKKLGKLEYSYDDQIQLNNRLWSNQRLMDIAAKRQWVETLGFLDKRNHPYELLGIFASWITFLENMERGLSGILLRETLRIAGWLGQDPSYIASLFVKKEFQ